MGPGDLRNALKGLPRPARNPRVLVDQTSLDDAGVYRLDRRTALVQTVDFFTPVVDDPYDYGRIAGANALSDVYAMGGRPLTSLALVCFPDALGPDVLREVLRGGQDTMQRAKTAIVGGHTVRDPELKFGYSVTGIVDPARMLTNANARPGDRLILTKPLGTGILATALKHRKLAPALERRLVTQMATLNATASAAAVRHGVRAATDITGFGLLGHATQMAEASGVTFEFAARPDWFLPRTLEFAEAGEVAGGLNRNREFFGPRVSLENLDAAMMLALFDPQTSGGLMLAVPERRAAALAATLRRGRVWAKVLGRAVRSGRQPVVVSG
jgi:selenide,water dikinase